MKIKTIADVRDHLFTLLDQLADAEKTPDYERLRASCEVAQVMVNTVRLQVDYLKVIHGDGDLPFLDEPAANDSRGTASTGVTSTEPVLSRIHRLGR